MFQAKKGSLTTTDFKEFLSSFIVGKRHHELQPILSWIFFTPSFLLHMKQDARMMHSRIPASAYLSRKNKLHIVCCFLSPSPLTAFFHVYANTDKSLPCNSFNFVTKKKFHPLQSFLIMKTNKWPNHVSLLDLHQFPKNLSSLVRKFIRVHSLKYLQAKLRCILFILR